MQQHPGVGRDDDRDVLPSGAGGREDPLALGLVDGEPGVGHGVAGQQVARPERRGRPAVADDLDALDLRVGCLPPGLQHRVDRRVELLLRRVPRLEQVGVDVDHVDRRDRGVGVGVGGEQRAAGPREQVHRHLEEVDAVHLRHPVVGQEHRHRVAPELQLAQRLEPFGGRRRAQHPVVLAVPAAEVAGDRAGDPRVVVHAEEDRLAHVRSCPAPASCGPPAGPASGGEGRRGVLACR